ncbi:MAG: hypothetical protein QXJ11_06795 [Candidatus Bathyarchaeia archaeon]
MSHWKIVFAATAFNLLFEYSMRGINNLAARPALPLFLFLVYFPYFAILEDLIAKYRLKDYNVAIAGFFFGTAFTLFVPATQFTEPQFFGVNWAALFFVNFFWWGMIQGVLTFYIATRLFPRNWNQKLLSRTQKTALLTTLVLVGLLYRISIQLNMPQAPRINPQAYIAIAITLAITALVFKRSIPKQATCTTQQKEKLIDALSALTIAIFAFCAVFLTQDPTQINVHNVNATATHTATAWTIIATLIMLGYRVYKRKPIPT